MTDRRPLRAYLDTHAAVGLWAGQLEVFGSRSRDLMGKALLLLSPIVRLELVYLHEVGKISVGAERMVVDLMRDLGVGEANDSLLLLGQVAQDLSWTRDPFDRLIVAQASLHQAPLITRDRRITEHYEWSVW